VIWEVHRTPAFVKGEAQGRALAERNRKFRIDGSSMEHSAVFYYISLTAARKKVA